jgi:hypothetical protein
VNRKLTDRRTSTPRPRCYCSRPSDRPSSQQNALSKHAVELHRRTGGYFKALAYLISTAAVIAIRSGSGSENITMKEIDSAAARLGP